MQKMNVVEKSLESRTPDNPSSSITILINTATSSTLDNNGDEKEKIQHLHSNLTTASSVFRCFEVQMTNSLFWFGGFQLCEKKEKKFYVIIQGKLCPIGDTYGSYNYFACCIFSDHLHSRHEQALMSRHYKYCFLPIELCRVSQPNHCWINCASFGKKSNQRLLFKSIIPSISRWHLSQKGFPTKTTRLLGLNKLEEKQSVPFTYGAVSTIIRNSLARCNSHLGEVHQAQQRTQRVDSQIKNKQHSQALKDLFYFNWKICIWTFKDFYTLKDFYLYWIGFDCSLVDWLVSLLYINISVEQIIHRLAHFIYSRIKVCKRILTEISLMDVCPPCALR